MAGKYPRCPFSGKKLDVASLASGYWVVSSEYGWKSKLFRNEEEARKWALSVPIDPIAIKEMTTEQPAHRVRYIVRGPGWYSKLFQGENWAKFWYGHRNGKKLKQTEEPLKVKTPDTIHPDDEIKPDFTQSDVESLAGELVEEKLRNAQVSGT